jgi:hypothetical protein
MTTAVLPVPLAGSDPLEARSKARRLPGAPSLTFFVKGGAPGTVLIAGLNLFDLLTLRVPV